jgi:hypothetical protein
LGDVTRLIEFSSSVLMKIFFADASVKFPFYFGFFYRGIYCFVLGNLMPTVYLYFSFEAGIEIGICKAVPSFFAFLRIHFTKPFALVFELIP